MPLESIITKLSTELDFQPITRVIWGEGKISSLAEHIQKLGSKKPLLVSDPGIVRAGHVERALNILAEAGIQAVVFDGVEENPTTEHVANGLKVAQSHEIDSIIGLGGGSSMDCAKGINFLYSCGGKMEDYWGEGKAGKSMLPLIAIPTTAGTGSETQSFALISNAETHQKMACGDKNASAKVAILDPVLTISQPFEVTSATGMDAISHAVESHVTLRKNAISQAFSREAWKLLATSFEGVLSTPDSVEHRGQMLLGASLAGMAIENSMLGASHALANPLTANFGIAHGVAIGLMLPHVVRFNSEVCESEYHELADVSGEPFESQLSGGERVAQKIEHLRERAGLPTSLKEMGVSPDAFPLLAEQAQEQWTGKFNPRPVTKIELEELYRCAL